jgi:hypothetical protein
MMMQIQKEPSTEPDVRAVLFQDKLCFAKKALGFVREGKNAV